MRIRRLNEQGEEEDKEDEQEEMQSEELTRSCSEFVLSYSSEMVDCITSLSDDDEEKESFVASRLGQKLGKMLESYASHCSGKNKTLLFRHVPDDTPTKRWLIDKFKLPTRTLRVSGTSPVLMLFNLVDSFVGYLVTWSSSKKEE